MAASYKFRASSRDRFRAEGSSSAASFVSDDHFRARFRDVSAGFATGATGGGGGATTGAGGSVAGAAATISDGFGFAARVFFSVLGGDLAGASASGGASATTDSAFGERFLVGAEAGATRAAVWLLFFLGDDAAGRDFDLSAGTALGCDSSAPPLAARAPRPATAREGAVADADALLRVALETG
jgi:hypothetical protein